MAKMTIGPVTYEGTPEELQAIVMTFPTDDAVAEKTQDDFTVGDKVRLLSGGDDYPLNGFKDGDVYEVAMLRYNHDTGERIQLEKSSGSNGYAKPEQLEKVTQAKPEKPNPVDKLTHKGADYSLVQRKAQPGDVVVFTENTSSCVDNETAYGPVTQSHRSSGLVNEEFGYLVYSANYNRTEANVLVYEKVAEEAPKYNKGDIIRAKRVTGDKAVIYAEVVDDNVDCHGNYGVKSYEDGRFRAVDGESIVLIARAKDRVDTK